MPVNFILNTFSCPDKFICSSVYKHALKSIEIALGNEALARKAIDHLRQGELEGGELSYTNWGFRLNLIRSKKIFKKIKTIEKQHRIFLKKLLKLNSIEKTRICGTILAFNIKGFGNGYKAMIPEKIKKFFLDKGLLLRPLGNVFYIMPPYCILKNELKYAYKIIYEGLKKI